MDTPIKEAFDAFSPAARKKALALRRLILQTAEKLPETGTITETLKWGEPAYLTEETKSGSTIRIGWKAKHPDEVGLYFNCQTTLVDGFRTRFPELRYEGNRALLLDTKKALPRAELKECISAALLYHRNKR